MEIIINFDKIWFYNEKFVIIAYLIYWYNFFLKMFKHIIFGIIPYSKGIFGYFQKFILYFQPKQDCRISENSAVFLNEKI